MKTYISITENNDWEAESWTFWIPKDDPAIQSIKDYIEENKLHYTYMIDETPVNIDGTPINENEVDIICAHAKEGYMYADNKVAWVNWPEEIDDDYDPLYKGGCYKYSKKPESE